MGLAPGGMFVGEFKVGDPVGKVVLPAGITGQHGQPIQIVLVGTHRIFGGEPKLWSILVFWEGDYGSTNAAHKAMDNGSQQGPPVFARGGSQG